MVCGLRETMETFDPRIRFSRLDLPTFGLPTSETMPKRFRPVKVLSLFPDGIARLAGGLLFSSLPARASSLRDQFMGIDLAMDSEFALVGLSGG